FTFTTGALSAAKHLHLLRDNLGAVLLLAVFLPLTGFQTTLDVDRRSLLQILASDFRQATEERDAMPFGGFAHLTATLVLKAIGGCHADVGDRVATGHVTCFRISTEVAHDDDLV